MAKAPTRKFPSRIGLLTAATCAALLLTADVGRAQEPEGGVRYSRNSGKAKTKETLDTKFQAAKKEEEKRRTRQVDMMDASAFAKKKKAVEQEMADKQIEFLKRLIKTTDKSDQEYPDLLFRLSDHFLEKKAYFDMQAGGLYDKIYAAEDSGNKAEAKQLTEKQNRFLAQAKDASENAAKVYKALVNDPAFAKYKRMDEALYYYAFELGDLGREQEMQAAYQQLINNYPNSQFISNAYLAFADYYFNKGQIQNAVRLYQKVIEFPDSPVFAYALYKLAWCHLNPIGTADARYDLSLNYFIKTIKATIEGRAGSEANAKQLRRDARRDLVRAYVHAAKPTTAWEFFEKHGKGPRDDENDVRRMMELLANQYFGDGQYDESTFIYKRLQKEFEGDPANCDWQAKIVVNTLATDNKEVQWTETKRLGEHWTAVKDGKFKKAIKRKCRDSALDTMKQMATVWHDEAEKTKVPRTYELAENAYKEFLGVFPGDKDAYELQYYYAELLWALATNNYNLKDKESRDKGLAYFKGAHDQFVNTLELDPKGKFTQDAAYAQMLAMKNYLEYDETGGKGKACRTNSEGECVYHEKKKKKPKKSKDTKLDADVMFPESDFSEDEKSMLGAYEIYEKYITKKDDKELPKIMYHRSKLMMEHNRFKEARPLLEKMVVDFDGTLYAAWCSEMLLDLLTISWVDTKNTPEMGIKSSEDLESWANKFMKMKVWNHPEADEVREAVPRLLAGIGWKKGIIYRDAGAAFVNGDAGGDQEGFKKCAEQFISVYNDHEDHDKAATLLWNAADCSDAAYMVGQAIQIRTILLDRYPDSEHAKDTLHFLAESFQAVAYYEDSAKRYEAFAEKYKADSRSSNALQNAYLFRLGLGMEEQAATNLTKYEAVYKKKDPQTAAKIFWSKHDLLKEDSERRKHAEDYLKTYGKRGGLDRQVVAEAVIAQLEWRKSCEEELLYDSCISIERKRVLSGVEEIEKRKKMQEREKRAEEKKKKKGEKEKFKPPKYCGSATQGIIKVHKRDKKKADAAQARFTRILKMVGKGDVEIPADDVNRVEAFRNAWGMAMVYRADARYEEYLKIDMPEELDFTLEEYKKNSGLPKWEKEYKAQEKKKAESEKLIKEFFDKKMGLKDELIKDYAVVKETKSPAWVLAAAARTGTVQQNLADQLYRAEVPQSFKTQEQVWAYCDTLGDFADPLQTAALEAFTYCVSKSTEFQYFNLYSRMCEVEMQQRDADKYPATNEMFGESIYTASRLEREDVFKDPTGARASAVKRAEAGEKKEGEEKAEGEDKDEGKKEGEE